MDSLEVCGSSVRAKVVIRSSRGIVLWTSGAGRVAIAPERLFVMGLESTAAMARR